MYFRVDGIWQRRNFTATEFVLLDESPLEDTINSIREMLKGVDAEAFMSTMAELRSE